MPPPDQPWQVGAYKSLDYYHPSSIPTYEASNSCSPFSISTVYLTTQTWTLGFRHKINWRERMYQGAVERENKSVKIEIKVYAAHKSALETRS